MPQNRFWSRRILASIIASILGMAAAKQNSITSEAALARKRRIAMRNKQRSVPMASISEDEISVEGCNKRKRLALDSEVKPVVVSSESVADEKTKSTPQDILESIKKKKPHITGIKKQSRYDPGVEMTKEELKAWRKEARRVRNRESAAASRQKNRESIEKLEVKVQGMQTKYDAALRYIMSLEEQLRRSGGSPSTSFLPSAVLRQDLMEARKSSPTCGVRTQTVSPPQSPTPCDPIPLGIGPQDEMVLDRTTNRQDEGRQWRFESRNDLDKNTMTQPLRHNRSHPNVLNSQKHIIDNTIIRPIACV
mmetsp:Transcript_34206/g.80575  ORF Transcript_34206/g.80575 Transcript_34206/m.80575 type:complete len:307 (-) Transcript_34206:745-1665(-)